MREDIWNEQGGKVNIKRRVKNMGTFDDSAPKEDRKAIRKRLAREQRHIDRRTREQEQENKR